MRVSLAGHRVTPRDPLASSSAPAAALLDPRGARVILGGQRADTPLPEPIAPAPDTMFGPRGAVLAAPGGPLVVADTGHHRLLIWNKTPDADRAPADMLIGQKDFTCEGRNGKGDVGPATLNVPTGVAVAGDVLAVADAWNHRVLIWHGLPARSNAPADVVLGQADMTGGLANRGMDTARADTLNWCYGVSILDGRLVVSDTGNRRVLVWDGIPERNGAPADLVLGQTDFSIRDENSGHGADAVGMRWPHAVVLVGDALLVTDAGNNRVMVWRDFPERNGAPCDFVLGQGTLDGVDHNRAAYYPTALSLNMPYGMTVLGDTLAVADTANSRIIGYRHDELAQGLAAISLAAQKTFADKGDNRWANPARNSLCWPYALGAAGDTLVISDSGNNRVMLWEAAQ